MKKTLLVVFSLWAMVLSVSLTEPLATAAPRPILKYSCSAQIYDALEKDRIDAFTKKTGIEVRVSICSSATAVNYLMRGFTDVAATARRLYPRHKQYGYWEIPFSRDPLAIIVNTQNPLSNLAEDELKDIFTGGITNWKKLVGADERIMVVLPDKNNAIYENFSRNALDRRDMVFDIITYKSTMVVEAVKRFPWAISFIAQGAAHRAGVKVVNIDGLAPADVGYPYSQVFSFVTKGKPRGPVKEFIDHLMLYEGKEMMAQKGIVPFYK